MAADERSAIPHPRTRHDLIGHAGSEAELAAAVRSGRLQHAWLIGGATGIGKATLAYRLARFLLADPAERISNDSLAVSAEGRTSRQVAAGSHANLMVLERMATGEKGAPKTISVDQVRKVLSFFSTTAADGGRRICIVDSIEDLNANGLNALLKTVEEPPPGGLLLLISHLPHRVLPTIRSRCRKLSLTRLTDSEITMVLSSLPIDHVAGERVAPLSEGSVSRALDLLEPRRLQLVEEIRSSLFELPHVSPNRIMRIAERMADKGGEDFSLGLGAVVRCVSERISDEAALGADRLAPLADACEKMEADAIVLEAYNLDRRAFVIGLFETLARAWRQGGLSVAA